MSRYLYLDPSASSEALVTRCEPRNQMTSPPRTRVLCLGEHTNQSPSEKVTRTLRSPGEHTAGKDHILFDKSPDNSENTQPFGYSTL